MRDRLIGLLGDFPILYSTIKDRWIPGEIKRLADHLLANGVIVPPCKVGDTMWVNYEYHKGKPHTYPVKVYAYRIDTKKNNMRICVEADIKITAYGGSYTHYYNGTFAWDSVGKSIFRTKEEAEKELERRKK